MDLWVIDTSSIIQVRQSIPPPDRPKVFNALTAAVDRGVLLFPKQVLDELEEATNARRDKTKPDLPYEWAKRNGGAATREGFSGENLVRILEDPIIARVVDPDKLGKEEADPYILELATRLAAQGHAVTVLTEDMKEKGVIKTSLRTACSILRIPSYGIEIFLERHGIWRKT